MNYYEAIEKLNDLRHRGVITEEEYQAEKSNLLSANQISQQWYIWGIGARNLLYADALCFLWFLPYRWWISVPWDANKDNTIVDNMARISPMGLSVVLYLIARFLLRLFWWDFFSWCARCACIEIWHYWCSEGPIREKCGVSLS
jgi:hypothetical protein